VDLRTLQYFVVVAQERHVGRAAVRLRMTQPPLTRAIHALEDEFGVALLIRTPRGVEPTAAGTELERRATDLLDAAESLRESVRAVAGAAVVRIGTLADSTEHIDAELTAMFRRSHPNVELRAREYDFSDPSAGLRSGETDVAFTRLPFETRGLTIRHLGSERIGVLLRRTDPLAEAAELSLGELTDRSWIRLPPTADPVWTAYWTGGPPTADEPVSRTVQEAVQSVLWNGRLALAPVGQRLPDPLTVVPIVDREASELVMAWRPSGMSPAARALVAAVGGA
jgi:DNA-binding transcriptional LysR family regulator